MFLVFVCAWFVLRVEVHVTYVILTQGEKGPRGFHMVAASALVPLGRVSFST